VITRSAILTKIIATCGFYRHQFIMLNKKARILSISSIETLCPITYQYDCASSRKPSNQVRVRANNLL